MSELTYIENLNIPVKYRGAILHAYEYNATVGKINEIVDYLHLTYETTKSFPRFEKLDDIFFSSASGVATLISDDYGYKLYPVTSSSYVIISDNVTLDDELELNRNKITELRGIIDDYEYTTNTSISNLNGDVDDLRSRISSLNNYVDELDEYAHRLELKLSYSPGTGIVINNNVISVNSNALIDNQSIQLDSSDKMIVNKSYVLEGAAEQLTFIDDHGNWIGDMANVKDYVDNSLNETTNLLNDNIINNANDIQDLQINMSDVRMSISYISDELICYNVGLNIDPMSDEFLNDHGLI